TQAIGLSWGVVGLPAWQFYSWESLGDDCPKGKDCKCAVVVNICRPGTFFVASMARQVCSACNYGRRIRIYTNVFSSKMCKSDSYLGGESRVRVCSHVRRPAFRRASLILMEEDYAPAVQHQRRVNPKIHDVIKKEVEKLLEAGLIYPISDSPWACSFMLFDLDLEPLSLSFDFIEHEHVVMNPTSAGMRHHHLHLYLKARIFNTYVLDYHALACSHYGTTQSRTTRYGYQEKNNNKDKTGQIRARDKKEREKTSPAVPSDFIGPARNPLNGPDQPMLS
ncbi:hypothetical protein Tco_0872572, partial [Tanacetum coccineum]